MYRRFHWRGRSRATGRAFSTITVLASKVEYGVIDAGLIWLHELPPLNARGQVPPVHSAAATTSLYGNRGSPTPFTMVPVPVAEAFQLPSKHSRRRLHNRIPRRQARPSGNRIFKLARMTTRTAVLKPRAGAHHITLHHFQIIKRAGS